MKIVEVHTPRLSRDYQAVVQRFTVKRPLQQTVGKIIGDVRKQGDAAVLKYTRRFDRLRLEPSEMRFTPQEIKSAYRKADTRVIASLQYAAKRITAFHETQTPKGWSARKMGVYWAQRIHPIACVGLYVPGGTAAYPSSVLMNAIPARVAGVPHRVICSPTPDGIINPYLLIAADIAGVDEIYRIGGAQAIAAMACGTETLPKVDKIVGPGNPYVVEAKRQVYGQVGIDLIAGPSELLVIADDAANPVYLAADLLSQAEHDPEAVVILITPSRALADAVDKESAKQQVALPRHAITATALKKHGVIFVVSDLTMAFEMANAIAPEHLSLFVKQPFLYLDKIVHAGSVFLGEMTPQSLGDYVAGPNHVLPTGGTARFSSPLSVEDFVKKSSVVSYTREALDEAGPHLARLAEVEGLTAHARTIHLRNADRAPQKTPKRAPTRRRPIQ